jgi:hypothetical protein
VNTCCSCHMYGLASAMGEQEMPAFSTVNAGTPDRPWLSP